MDWEAWLCDLIRAHVGVAVSTDLPPKFETVRLPVVQVSGLPGDLSMRPWGGPALRREQPADVDVYAASREEASDTAFSIANHLDGKTVDGLRVEVTSTPHERPDQNDKIRRFGMIVTISGRR